MCRYEIFKGSEFVKRTKSSSYTFGASDLPEGTTTLWVRAIDPEGADVRASYDVTVLPKLDDFDVEGEIASINVRQVVGSNDPSMLALAGNQLSTLTGMAKGTSNKNSKGRRLLEAGAAGGSSEDIGEVVKVKVVQLLSALTSSATGSINDAASMRQVSLTCWCAGCTA